MKDKYTPWYKEPYMIIVFGVPLSSIIISSIIVTLAVQGRDSLISDSYYKDGVSYIQNNSASKTAKKRNIKALVDISDIRITLKLNGLFKLLPNVITATLTHPTLAHLDQSLILSQQNGNTYVTDLPSPLFGKWILTIQSPVQEWLIKGPILLPSSNKFTINSDIE
jgi:hypothetical protein